MRPQSLSRAGVLTRLSPPEALAREAEMLDRVARCELDVEILVWSTDACLVAPRSLSRLPEFEVGKAKIEAHGLSLHLRETGGDLMPQGPSVLNVTVAFAALSNASFGVGAAYHRLCSPLVELLRTRGVAAYCAAVPGAFCDGRFNVAVACRKLAGTAQRWRAPARFGRTKDPRVAVLAHAAIFASADFHRYVDAANAFYAACGVERHVCAEAHVALSELAQFSAELCGSNSPEALAAVVLSCYERAFVGTQDADHASPGGGGQGMETRSRALIACP